MTYEGHATGGFLKGGGGNRDQQDGQEHRGGGFGGGNRESRDHRDHRDGNDHRGGGGGGRDRPDDYSRGFGRPEDHQRRDDSRRHDERSRNSARGEQSFSRGHGSYGQDDRGSNNFGGSSRDQDKREDRNAPYRPSTEHRSDYHHGGHDREQNRGNDRGNDRERNYGDYGHQRGYSNHSRDYDGRQGGHHNDSRGGGGYNDNRHGGHSDSRYGGHSDSRYGGHSDSRYGGYSDSRYGGSSGGGYHTGGPRDDDRRQYPDHDRNYENYNRDRHDRNNGSSNNSGFRSDNDNGFGRDGGRGGYHQGGRRFDNDGGFQSGSGGGSGFRNDGGFNSRGGNGAYGRSQEDPTVQRAPMDYMPQLDDVNDIIKKVSEQTTDLNINQDQELEIRNSNIDTKLTSWENSGLHPKLIENVRKLNYKSVRPIQAAVLPQVMAGNDVMGQAETGGGKTAAFGLPIVNKILNIDEEEREQMRGLTAPLALILAPTRELARQIYDNMLMFSNNTDIKVCLTYGQMNRRESLSQITRGCDVLVGTCGRIMDFVKKNEISLKQLKFFVLDEADRLLADSKESESHLRVIFDDPGFQSTNNERQTILTSATFDAPIEAIARSIMRPVRGQEDLVRIVLARGRLNLRVHLSFYETPNLMDKQLALRKILMQRDANGEIPKTLVFVEKKVQCNNITYTLAEKNIKAMTLHGDIGQDRRDAEIARFRKGELRILVATDVMARGIDILDLQRVINFDLPTQDIKVAVDTFVHRTGRTGRLTNGEAISFVDSGNPTDRRICPEIVELIKSQDRAHEIPEWLNEIARSEASNPSYEAARRPRATGFGSFGSGATSFGGGASSFGGGASSFGGGRDNLCGGSFGGSNDNDGSFGGANNDAPKVSSGFGNKDAKPPAGGFGLQNKLESSENEKLGSSTFGEPDAKSIPPPPTMADSDQVDPEDEW